MKSTAFIAAIAAAACSSNVDAFSSFNGQQLQNVARNAGGMMTMEYIPR